MIHYPPWLLLGLLVATLPACAADQLRVLKHGDEVFVRCAFSPQEDLVVRIGKGANRQINFSSAFLIKAEASMSVAELSGGRMIHGNGDDSTPWNLNGTYIGANHGCSDGRELVVPNHGLTAADLGSAWQDGAGLTFYLLRIVDANRLWFLSANQGQGDIWKFVTTVTGPSLKRAADGATLAFTECKMAQLTPSCRIARQDYLVDGQTAAADDAPISCGFFDIVEDYDVIDPGALEQDFVAHPGEQRSFTGEGLAGVVRNHITYRFYPNGANVILYRAEALQDFNLGYMGFIQSAKLATGAYDSHLYYVPKTLPFTQDNINYDFRAGQDYTITLPTPVYFSVAKNNVADPQNLPGRFIQLLGHKGDGGVANEVGFALGYSLVNGMTVPAQHARNVRQAAMLYTSSKTYPSACDSAMGQPIKAGTIFECTAYRQYFWPGAQKNATCCYWHPEGDETVVYADYHKSVDHDVLALPAEWAGKTLSVIEKTPSLTIHTEGVIPATGVAISVTDGYGDVVFRVK